MSRYPFSDRIDEYIQSCGTRIGNNESNDAARRHLRNMGRVFHQLRTEGIIGSDNPSQITVRDVQSYTERRRSDGASDSTVRRDLGYLNGYLLFHDNDSALVFLEDVEERRREIDALSSANAFKRIMNVSARPDCLGWNDVKAFSFVVLIIVLGLRPEQLRKSFYSPGQYTGCPMDHFIDYIDNNGEKIHIKLDLDRMPVVERYIKDPPLDLKMHHFSKRPLFPSGNPLFDFASPEDVRNMKKLVEKQIGQKFDYRICQRVYNSMKVDDEEPQAPKRNTPMFVDPSLRRKGSIIGRVSDLFR